MSAVKHVDGDVSEEFAQKYRNMMPFDVVGVYSPNKLDCGVGSARNNRKHIYVVVAEKGGEMYFYAGITGRTPVSRWKEHLGIGAYSGATFLEDKSIRAFILVARRAKNAEEIEDKIALQLMAKYGTRNVSGGKYAVDRSPRQDLPDLFNPSEYDFLSDVDRIEAEPIPKSEAHKSIVKGPIMQVFILLWKMIEIPLLAIYTLVTWSIIGIIGFWIVGVIVSVIILFFWVIWTLLPF